MPAITPRLVLASSSSARRLLLERLHLPFTCDSPDIDERPLPGESAALLVTRLSEAKARAVAARHPDSLVIGSDQVAELGGELLGKPGTHPAARRQLQRLSGRTVIFHTGLAVLNTRSGRLQRRAEIYSTTFRTLSEDAIERYLATDMPYDCAGSFKSEGLGIALFHAFAGRDPTTLIGLPLMALVDLLAKEGIAIP